MTPDDYLEAARCPPSLPLGEFGRRQIERLTPRSNWEEKRELTILSRWTEATLHRHRGEVVMEDSARELRRHLPIWHNAWGRVLVTGLGLGCVVRGLLAKPEVEHVTVIELDPGIIRMIWPEFADNDRLSLYPGDAMTVHWPPGIRWDWAWHDIWREGYAEALLHAHLMVRYVPLCTRQGAWGMPRLWRRKIGGDFLTTL